MSQIKKIMLIPDIANKYIGRCKRDTPHLNSIFNVAITMEATLIDNLNKNIIFVKTSTNE